MDDHQHQGRDGSPESAVSPGRAEHAKHADETRKADAYDKHAGHMAADFRQRFWISLVVTAPILLLSPSIQGLIWPGWSTRFPGDDYLLFLFSSTVFFYGGYPFLNGLFKEIKARVPGMMTLIAVAISTAYVYSTAVVFGLKGMVFFWELATLVDIMLLGHWIEMRSISGASRALEELARLLPSDAHKLMSDGKVIDVPLSELKVGDRVLVKPGEKSPADGIVLNGQTSFNEAVLTGESLPVLKKTGDKVIGGSINGEGSVMLKVMSTGKDSFLAQVIDLVKEAQASRSKTQGLADRAAMWLTLIALGGGALTFIVWIAIMKMDLAFALERTVTVMVTACPHALGLAVPLVVAVSTAIAASKGLLIRNRIAFEQAREIKAIIFDKTGTLTEGRFGVTDVWAYDREWGEDELLTYAASIEARSEHPIAQGVVASSKEVWPVEMFKALPGQGTIGMVKGKEIRVVSPGYLRENGLSLPDEKAGRLSNQGKTVVFVIIDGKLGGAIALADVIRAESSKAISRLRQMNIKVMMLTGDKKEVAEWVSAQLDLDEYFAEVLPHDKAAKVKEVQARGMTVAMTGDGVNDAPALAQADIGIAIGAGTDVAVEAADIVLIRNNPLDTVVIIELARATYSKMIQNLAWATGYNVIALPLAAGVLYQAGVLLTPAAGAVLMSLSTVIVAINARMLKR